MRIAQFMIEGNQRKAMDPEALTIDHRAFNDVWLVDRLTRDEWKLDMTYSAAVREYNIARYGEVDVEAEKRAPRDCLEANIDVNQDPQWAVKNAIAEIKKAISGLKKTDVTVDDQEIGIHAGPLEYLRQWIEDENRGVDNE